MKKPRQVPPSAEPVEPGVSSGQDAEQTLRSEDASENPGASGDGTLASAADPIGIASDEQITLGDAGQGFRWSDAYRVDPPEVEKARPPLYRRGAVFVGLFAVMLMAVLAFAHFQPFSLKPAQSVPDLGEITASATLSPNPQESAGTTGKPSTSWLSIASTATGATVAVDFDSVGIIPLQRYPLKPGAYVVSLRQRGYAAMDTVVFIREGNNAYYLPLSVSESRPLLASDNSVLPTPQSPARSVQQEEVPLPTRDLPSNVTPPPAARRQEAQQTVSREPDAEVTQGMLLTTSEPAGAILLLDGVPHGETPLFLQNVSPGRHALILRLDGFTPYVTQVDVEMGETAKVSAQLKALSGSLIILVQPWGSIYIDGKLQRKDTDVQFQTSLLIGPHHVRVVHPTLGTWERLVEVEGGTAQRLFVSFQQAKGEEGSRPDVSPPTVAEADKVPVSAAVLSKNGIYITVDEAPQLIGGMQSLYRRAEYPSAAREARLEGTVVVRFVVDETGRVQDAEVSRSIGMGCDMEALRLVRSSRFTPGKVLGEPVKVWQSMPITFKLADK